MPKRQTRARALIVFLTIIKDTKETIISTRFSPDKPPQSGAPAFMPSRSPALRGAATRIPPM